MKHLWFGLSVFFFFLTTSCATVSFNIPVNRFLSPENSGESFHGRVGGSFGSNTKVKLVDDITTNKPVTDEPEQTEEYQASPVIEMSAIPALDIFYAASGFGLKFQPIGNTMNDAKAGDNSLAFALAVDAGKNEESEKFDFGDVEYENKGVARYRWFDLMALAGHRMSDMWLGYVNLGYISTHADGTITKTVKSGKDEGDEEKIDVDGANGYQITALIGFQFTLKHYFLMLEPGLVHSHWPGADDYTHLAFGVSTGFKW